MFHCLLPSVPLHVVYVFHPPPPPTRLGNKGVPRRTSGTWDQHPRFGRAPFLTGGFFRGKDFVLPRDSGEHRPLMGVILTGKPAFVFLSVMSFRTTFLFCECLLYIQDSFFSTCCLTRLFLVTNMGLIGSEVCIPYAPIKPSTLWNPKMHSWTSNHQLTHSSNFLPATCPYRKQ